MAKYSIFNQTIGLRDAISGTYVEGMWWSDTGKVQMYNYFVPDGEDVKNTIMLECKNWNNQVEPNPQPGDPIEIPKPHP